METGPPAEPRADAPLRRDVRLLGTLLGRVVVDQEGEETLAAEERVRALSREARETGDLDAVRDAVRALPPDGRPRCYGRSRSTSSSRTSRSSSTGCAGARQHAEARGRARVARRRVRAPRRGPRVELASRLARVSLELVLTAHPTEATRRTLLLAHVRIARAARAGYDDPRLTVPGRARVEEELVEQITILWQTDEVRHERPRVADEIRHGLWFFERAAVDAAERLPPRVPRRLPAAAPPLSFGSWIGGDMDGNPNTGPETIARGARPGPRVALGRYRAEVRALAGALAMHRSLVGVSAELDDSIARDERELPEYAAEIGPRNEVEPYRRKLSFMWWRLGNDGYRGPDELLADLDVLARSLEANRGARIAAGRLGELRRRVELFGFHVAKLDLRVHARDRDGRAREAIGRRGRGPAHGTDRRRSTR